MTSKVYDQIARGGASVNAAALWVGRCALFGLQALGLGVAGIFRRRIYPRTELFRQIELTGTRSLPIVVLVSGLLGMTLVAQAVPTMAKWGTEVFVAGIVGVSITRTLGPVLTAIVFTGRVGAAFTAEIGTKKVSDELLALETMGINPIGFVVAPRILAGLITLMGLTVIFDLVALSTAYMIAIVQFNIPGDRYVEVLKEFVTPSDFLFGVFKASIFSATLSTIACFKGVSVRGSGEDVGRATMESVVVCIVIIIFADFVLSMGFNVLAGWEVIDAIDRFFLGRGS